MTEADTLAYKEFEVTGLVKRLAQE